LYNVKVLAEATEARRVATTTVSCMVGEWDCVFLKNVNWFMLKMLMIKGEVAWEWWACWSLYPELPS
jgi:hypothetical protein